jgi:ABC-type multidrug transport system ATPase subunit
VLLPTAGEVAVLGGDPCTEPATRARLGFLGHQSFLEPAEDAGSQVEFCHRFRGGGEPGPEALREALELDDVWDAPAATLSRGFGRRVELACVMAGGPALLLLDEPLGGLDRERRRRLAALVRELLPRAAVLVATHRPEDLRSLTPRQAALADGRLGEPSSLPAEPRES